MMVCFDLFVIEEQPVALDCMMKILLVDDDEDDRQFFADALDGLDMNTELVQLTNGEECLDYMEDHKEDCPNLLFLDLNMPIMNGLEAT